MCGRFNVTSDPLIELFEELTGQPYSGGDHYNTSPTQPAWVIGTERNSPSDSMKSRYIFEARWGLVPFWSKEPVTKYSTFNARCETIAKSAAYRGPFQYRRCLVPVTGYYEWVNRNGRKQPYYIADGSDKGLLLGGIWDRWQDHGSGDDLYSFSIVTMPVAPDLAFLHHRQPLMLNRTDATIWLESDSREPKLQSLFEPRLAVDISVTPVSTFVSNSRNQGPQCIEPEGDRIELGATH